MVFSSKNIKAQMRSDEFDTDGITAKKRATVQDMYDCIKWEMANKKTKRK